VDTDIDPETHILRITWDIEGNIGHTIIKLGNFGDALKELNQAFMVNLSKTSDGKADPKIALIAQDLRGVFNKFRTHIRNEYPEQYIQIKNLLGEIINSI
jgi:hypothetical protein